jgi:hypothetical protein
VKEELKKLYDGRREIVDCGGKRSATPLWRAGAKVLHVQKDRRVFKHIMPMLLLIQSAVAAAAAPAHSKGQSPGHFWRMMRQRGRLC